MISLGKRIGLFYKKGNLDSFNKATAYLDKYILPLTQKNVNKMRSGFLGTLIKYKNGDVLELVGISEDSNNNQRGRRYDEVIVDRQYISLQEYETIIKPLIKPNELFI